MASEFDALKPVQSSMFSRAGYVDATWTLVLEFKSTGEIRAYKNVAPEVAEEALRAKSLGQWWNQNIRGNADWESELLGADPSLPVKEAPKKQTRAVDPECGLTEEELNYIAPDPALTTGIPVEAMGLQPTVAETYGGIKRTAAPGDIPGRFPEPSSAGDINVQKLQNYFGVTEFGPNTGCRPNSDLDENGDVKESAMTRQTQGEIMPKWEAPESAAEALDLMAQYSTEIAAVIAANIDTGQQALTVRIVDAGSRLEASEVLDRLVAKTDTTKTLLDPFRKVLYEAYTEAGDKVKKALGPLEQGVAHVKGIILAYDRAQEAIRQQKMREAREAAEAEARRLQQEEQQRLTLAEVTDAIEEGDMQRAETLFDKPVEVPRQYVAPEYIPPAAPQIKGQSGRQNWKIVEEELDLVAFLRAVKEDKFPLDQAANLVSFNIPALNGLARSLKKAFDIPGARAEDQGSLSVRRKK